MQVAVRPIRYTRRPLRGMGRVRRRGLGDDSVFDNFFGGAAGAISVSAGSPFAAVIPAVEAAIAPLQILGSDIVDALPTWAGGTGGQLTQSQVQQQISIEAASVCQAANGSMTPAQCTAQATQDQTGLHTVQQQQGTPVALPWWANPAVLIAGAAGLLILARRL